MKKIGIITIHSDIHYGAALQSCALAKFLSEKYFARIIDYRKIPTNLPNFSPLKMFIYNLRSAKRTFRYRRFVKPFLSNKRYNSLDELMNSFSEDFDIIITGSDQVWNPKVGGVEGLNPAYFNAFAPIEKYKKISYASSVGNYSFNDKEKDFVNKWLSEYSHISTRESYGKDQLEKILNKEVALVLDPTLLLNKKDWLDISKPVKINEKYVLVYNVGSTIEKDAKYAREIADKNNWKVVFMSIKLTKDPNIDINIPHCGPEEFVWLFANAEFIVTSSFHGVAFSLNLEKQFINVYNPKSPQRIQELLEKMNLEERSIKSIEDIKISEERINYIEVSPTLDKHRASSIKYLINAIEN